MPILDLQRRHSTTFRLRIGEQRVSAKTGKKYPVRLTDSIRVTAPTPGIVDAFVECYGGERKPWEGQWEAKLSITQLPIVLLPGQSLTAWWETWRGAVCVRRCDGYEQTTGEPCACPSDIDARMADKEMCSPTTRLSVICPDVAVLGAGMLVTHGRIAAEELPSSVQVAEVMLNQGIYVPATLVVEELVGPDRRYVVPRIYPPTGVSFAQLQSGHVPQAINGAATPAIDRPSSPALGPAPERPDEGPGESAAPPASPNRCAASVLDMLADLTPEQKVAIRAEWKDRGIRSTTDPEFGPADVEAASELVMPYLEATEQEMTT